MVLPINRQHRLHNPLISIHLKFCPTDGWYDSKTTNTARRMHIYTPPGYDTSGENYPVLYLIHGGGEDDVAWSTIGRAGFIMDNLLMANKVSPMIIVMPNGKIELPGLSLRGSDIDWKSPEAVAERMKTIIKLHDLFIDDLLTTIIPLVEKSYRVLPNRDKRAIAGLSMGGAETLRAGPSNLDLFAYFKVTH
jgi:enterochelin esterase-like enzyme